MKRKIKWAVSSLVVIMALLFAYLFFFGDHEADLRRWSLMPHSPEEVLEKFYKYEGAEDQKMDPLILGGEAVVPLVIKSVEDKDMPGRLYAIGFLGNGSFTEALDVLVKIVEDENENQIIRGRALRSIFQINEEIALELAKKYSDEGGKLAWSVELVLSKDAYLYRKRTHKDAFEGRHD